MEKKMSITITVSSSSDENGRKAALKIADVIRKAVNEKGKARIVLSTGMSQFEMFNYLVKEDVEWGKVEMFHLDEYVGISPSHPASFRKYLFDRFVSVVHPGIVHYVDGTDENIRELTKELRKEDIDLGVIGIGENGHIAFNDPPADFESDDAYRVVTLDERCRLQQVGEGWFESISSVPGKAVSMTPKEIMRAKTIVSVVPHSVKADAIYNTITKPVSPYVPATLLKTHPDWYLFLDSDSASKLLGTGDEKTN